MNVTLIINWPLDPGKLSPGIEALLKSTDADLRETATENFSRRASAEAPCEASVDSRHKAAQAWQHPTTSGTVMDPVLAEAFAVILDEEKARLVRELMGRGTVCIHEHEGLQKLQARTEHERDNWIETCAQQARDLTTYQNVLDRIGLLFGEDAFTCDDGSRSDEVLRAKVPDLVFDAMKELWAHRQRQIAGRFGQSIPLPPEAPVDTAEARV